jgi:ankyrin repeat protein
VLCSVEQDFVTALMWASKQGHTATVQALIGAGAELNRPGCGSALMYASEEGHTATVQALLGAGANPDLQNTVSKPAYQKGQK